MHVNSEETKPAPSGSAALSARLGRRSLLQGSLGVAALISLASCSSPDSPKSAGSSASAGSGPFAKRPSEPFQPSTGSGNKTGLPRVVASNLAVVNSPNYVALADGMKDAVTSGGMKYVQTVNEQDSTKSVNQLTTLLNRGVGAVFVWDAVPDSQRPIEQQLRQTGAATFTLANGPSTTPIAIVQKSLGAKLAMSAVDFIKTKLDGKAQVAMFNLDQVASVKPAFQEIRDQLIAIGPGVKIVSDVTDDTNDPTFGLNTMKTVLQAHPDVDVVIGLDTTMYSAMQAMQDAGKNAATTFIGGLAGDPRVGDLIASGTSLYKASASFLLPMLGYAPGRWGVDWIEGKNVPQLCILTPVMLDSAAAITEYNNDFNDLAGVYNDPSKLVKYLELLGTVNYANRENVWDETDPSGAAG
jgi:ribose transport system substrate-binding protein